MKNINKDIFRTLLKASTHWSLHSIVSLEKLSIITWFPLVMGIVILKLQKEQVSLMIICEKNLRMQNYKMVFDFCFIKMVE